LAWRSLLRLSVSLVLNILVTKYLAEDIFMYNILLIRISPLLQPDFNLSCFPDTAVFALEDSGLFSWQWDGTLKRQLLAVGPFRSMGIPVQTLPTRTRGMRRHQFFCSEVDSGLLTLATFLISLMLVL